MPEFDWNKNGKKDNFDRYMDIKVMSSVSEDEDIDNFVVDEDIEDIDNDVFDGEMDSDYDELDIDDDINDEVENIDVGIIDTSKIKRTNVYNKKEVKNSNEEKEISFQEELKKNMKTPEVVQREKYEIERNSAMWEAERTMKKIKEYLLYKVQHAEYEQEDGTTLVSCTCDINQLYLKSEWYDNSSQLKQNKETLFLFRDRNLVYKSGYHYDIKSDYRKEYDLFITALKELARKEKIVIETVLVNKGKLFPFPYTLDSLSGYVKLCVKATIIISGNNSSHTIKTVNEKQIEESISKLNKMQEQNRENWAMTGKCILVVGIIILALIICLNSDIGPLGMALLMIGSVVLGCIILCKSSK